MAQEDFPMLPANDIVVVHHAASSFIIEALNFLRHVVDVDGVVVLPQRTVFILHSILTGASIKVD